MPPDVPAEAATATGSGALEPARRSRADARTTDTGSHAEGTGSHGADTGSNATNTGSGTDSDIRTDTDARGHSRDRALGGRTAALIRDGARQPVEHEGLLGWSLVVLVSMLGAGVVAAFAWSALAEPAVFTVTADGASMGETAAGEQFGVEVLYAALAAGLGLGTGALAGRRLARYGWVLAVVLLVGALGAAGVSLYLGRLLGPADPTVALASARAGDLVAARLDVEASGLLLTWPIAALGGFLAAISRSTDRADHPS